MQKYFLLFSLLFLGAAFKSNGQNNAAALAAADTVNFSRNAAGGWQLYNSYINAIPADSVLVELILQHSNTITWTQEQYTGKIKAVNLRPNTVRIVSFLSGDITYQLRIDTMGKCYLKLLSGAAPTADPVIIPVTVKFKK